MKRFSCLILLILSLLISIPLYSQQNSASIQGYVFDDKNNAIENVNVIIEPGNLADVTDKYGYFQVNKLKLGKYAITFRHVSYTTEIIQNVEIDGTENINLPNVILRPRTISFDKIIVTATKKEQSVYDVSKPINLVNSAAIKQRSAKTSAEALRDEVGVFVQKTSHGGGSAILRGLSSNQILLLVDGVRLNNSTYRLGNHQYLTTVDNQMADQIEIVRGPASVLYGSDALGGSINVITKKPSFVGNTFNFRYKILGRYASADDEKTTRTEFALSNSKFAFQSGISVKDYGNLRRGENSDYLQLENSTDGAVQNPTKFKAYDFDTKLIYQFNTEQSLILAYQLSKQKDVPRYDKYENGGYHLWTYHPQNRQLLYLTYNKEFRSNFWEALRATFSFQRQEEGRNTQKNTDSPIVKERDVVDTFGVTFQAEARYERHSIISGVDLYFDDVGSKRYSIYPTGERTYDVRGRYPDNSDYNSIGVYLQDDIRISQKINLLTGIRYSYFQSRFTLTIKENSSNFNGENTQNFTAITGNMGAVYKMAEGVFLNANLGQAFRAPNLSDLTKLGESKGNIYEVPNPELEPEKMLSFDLGLKVNKSRIHANASVYYSHIQDILVSAGAEYNGSETIETGGVVYDVKSKKNIGKAYITGVETELAYNFAGSIWMYGNCTATYGQNTTVDEPIGKLPPLFGLLGLRWRTNNFNLQVYMRFARKQDRLSADDKDDPRIPDGGTPGWQTYNVRIGTEFLKHISLWCSVENILDYNYREHASGINAPGRNFIISAEIHR